MADKDYSVDDILNEIRARKGTGVSAEPAPRGTAREAAPREGEPKPVRRAPVEPVKQEREAYTLPPWPGLGEAPVKKEPTQPQGEYFPGVKLALPQEPQTREEAKVVPLPRTPRREESAIPKATGKTAPVQYDELAAARRFDAAAAAQRLTGSGGFDFEEELVRKAEKKAAPPPRAPRPQERREEAPPRRTVTIPAPLIPEEEGEEEPLRHAKGGVKARAAARLTAQEEDEEAPRRPQEKKTRGGRKKPEAGEEREERQEQPERPEQKERPGAPRRTLGTRVGSQLQGMKTKLILRLMVNLITALGVGYLALAPLYELPIPEFFMDNANLYLWLEVGLVALSALVSGNTVGGGMISLFCLRPNNDSYSAIGVFACLVQGSYVAMRPEMMEQYSANLYLPMGALLLLFNTLGKLFLRGRVEGSYRFIAQEGAKHTAAVLDNRNLSKRLGAGVIEDEAEIAYFSSSDGVSSFMDQAFSESKAEDISKIIAPMTAAAALVMAVISYPFHKDIFTSACVFTAALCITAPIAGVIASNLPIAVTNRRLRRWGATLCGYSTVDQFADVNGVVLRCSDLFPLGSVTLHSIKAFHKTPIDEVVLDAASVLHCCDSTLTQVFDGMISGPDILQPVESLAYEDGMGVSAWVNGRRVLVGNRELMKAHGVDLPPREYEEKYGQGKELLYLSNSGQAAAMYILSYKADKQMRRSLELLADRDIAVCIYSTDPNVTEEKVSKLYGFPKELLRVVPATLHRDLEEYLDPKSKTPASIVHNGSPASYVRAVAAARSCDSILTVETALILLSVVIGFALVTFFAFTKSMAALTWVTIAAYQGFWAAVQLVLPLFKKV